MVRSLSLSRLSSLPPSLALSAALLGFACGQGTPAPTSAPAPAAATAPTAAAPVPAAPASAPATGTTAAAAPVPPATTSSRNEAGSVEQAEKTAADASRPPRSVMDTCLIVLARAVTCRDDPAFRKAIGDKAGSLYQEVAKTLEDKERTCAAWTDGSSVGGATWSDPSVRRKLVASADRPCDRFGAAVAALGGLPAEKQEGG